ncbi:hypothetical protein [Desertibacillus haloalkaliphilus]|uniref:hypothetical protein n=1 Tax=Desertibacillus haloalkaliphilus TaxID=1328930 RepID=UPI001C266D99|nr:hypothetical protein [Desertibacillus haloalkaliphilus]MBU8908522.1 hypothetical protein [Desertibacillus haloalkaliphilus]
MINVYKIILLIILAVSFIGSVGEKEDKGLRNNMAALCIASMVSFIVSVIYL